VTRTAVSSRGISSGAYDPPLGAALDADRAAAFVADRGMRLVGANARGCVMLGYSRDELLSLSIPDIDASARLEAVWEQLVETGFHVGQARLKRRDGSAMTVDYEAKEVIASGTRLYLWIAVPRLPSRQTERSRRPSEPRGERDLTSRELEILQLLSDGLDNDEIAAELCISVETVKSHVRRLLKKLDAKSRTHAVAVALRRRIVE
jgi:PAS domain S-box-containing protein